MFKRIWKKIKQNHLFLMILCCLIPVIFIVVIFPLFRGSAGGWIWLIMLLCPLSHIFMMKGLVHDDACKKEGDKKYKGRKN